MLKHLLFLTVLYSTQSFSQTDVRDLLQTCRKKLSKLDIQNPDLIGKISENCSEPSEGTLTPVFDHLAKFKPDLLDAVNDNVMEKSIDAYLSFAVARRVSPVTGKPFDLENVKDVIYLRKKICGFDDIKNSPSYHVCDSENNVAILNATLRKVKKRNIRFQGTLVSKDGTLSFKHGEYTTFQTEISFFNQMCEKLKNGGNLISKPKLIIDPEDTRENKEFLIKTYNDKMAKYVVMSSTIKAQMARVFDAPLGWLMITDSMRENMQLDGRYESPETFCSQKLTTPSIPETNKSLEDFQNLQLKEIGSWLTHGRLKHRWGDNAPDVQYDQQNDYRLRKRILNNIDSIAEELEKNPSPENVKKVCTAVGTIYGQDKIDDLNDKILMTGSLVIGAAGVAVGLGAPIGAAVSTALIGTDVFLNTATLGYTVQKYQNEKDNQKRLMVSSTSSNRRGNIPEILESNDKQTDLQVDIGVSLAQVIFSGSEVKTLGTTVKVTKPVKTWSPSSKMKYVKEIVPATVSAVDAKGNIENLVEDKSEKIDFSKNHVTKNNYVLVTPEQLAHLNNGTILYNFKTGKKLVVGKDVFELPEPAEMTNPENFPYGFKKADLKSRQ